VFILVSTFLSQEVPRLFPSGLLLELVVLIALVLVILLFTRVVVRVVQTDFGRGLEIVYGPGGVVRQVFEPAEVEGTYARNLSFAEMGAGGTGKFATDSTGGSRDKTRRRT